MRKITITFDLEEDYPKRLKRILEKYDITRTEICRYAGMTEHYLYDMMFRPSPNGGPQCPRIDTVLKIETTIEYIINRRRKILNDEDSDY